MGPTSFDRDLLLIAADLNERRLLYGELLEAGYDVLPASGFAVALGLLLEHSVVPRLILLDVQGDEHATPHSVEHLAAQIPDARLLVLVGAIDRALWEPLEGRVAALLHRPITIGRIVEKVKEFLSPPERPQKASSD
jgi:response regulator RpfG family c-di-GMP phosphodiesterase